MNLASIEAKPFVPAMNFDLSKCFYTALGFEIPWSSEDLAYVRHGETSFLLQAFDVPAFASNFQMHLLVECADDWHSMVNSSGVIEQFGVTVGSLADQPWAMRDFTLNDPRGCCGASPTTFPARPIATGNVARTQLPADARRGRIG
jgi:hypothetical protein